MIRPAQEAMSLGLVHWDDPEGWYGEGSVTGPLELEQAQSVLDAGMGTDEAVQQVPLGFVKPP